VRQLSLAADGIHDLFKYGLFDFITHGRIISHRVITMSTSVLFQSKRRRVSSQPMADEIDENDAKAKGDPELAARIVEAMDKWSGGKSQKKIAEEVGVTPQSLTKSRKFGYMEKRRIPAFCRSCNVSIEWFITGEGDPQANPLRAATSDQITQAAQMLLSPAAQLQLARDLLERASKGLSESE
jgi:hypothetical protein